MPKSTKQTSLDAVAIELKPTALTKKDPLLFPSCEEPEQIEVRRKKHKEQIAAFEKAYYEKHEEERAALEKTVKKKRKQRGRSREKSIRIE